MNEEVWKLSRTADDQPAWDLLFRLFADLPIGLITFRPDMSVERINRAGAQMLGFAAPDEMLGRVLYDLLPATRERKPIYDRVLAGESIDLPDAEVRVRDQLRNYDVHYRPIEDASGSVSGFLVVAYEITSKRQAERERRLMEERFETLYDATPDMLLAVEFPSKRILECNRALCQTLGYRKDEVIGKTLLDFYDPGCWHLVERSIETLLEQGHVKEVELQVRTRTGRTVDIELNSLATRDESGAIVGTLGVWHDITKRKLAEERLLRSESQLRDLSNRVLQVQEEERARLSRELHDEVGQIFTGMRLDLAWIAKRLDDTRPELSEKIETMDRLIGESIRRVQRIARSLRPDVLDRLGLVSAIEWQIDEFERRTSIRCELRVEPREIETGTEISTAVYRILQEALTNITRHSGARKAEVELQVRDTTLKLTIQDDGSGLDPRRLAEGKSLGLKGMEERARLLAGRFDVRSLATGGTQIVVEIPIRTER